MTARVLLMLTSILTFLGCAGGKRDAQFKALTQKAMADLQTKTIAQQQAWGFGKSDRWDINQSEGKLVFTFPDKTVTCEAQIIGSFDKFKGTWLWAWQNPSVETNLAQFSKQLRDYGATNHFTKLTTPEWKATEQDAWEMVALATFLCNAQGAYRGPAGDVYVFMTFAASTIQKR
ncbi:MAG TPA: hypothetical protein VI282_03205 [Verrucomicrobiae bacterium]